MPVGGKRLAQHRANHAGRARNDDLMRGDTTAKVSPARTAVANPYRSPADPSKAPVKAVDPGPTQGKVHAMKRAIVAAVVVLVAGAALYFFLRQP